LLRFGHPRQLQLVKEQIHQKHDTIRDQLASLGYQVVKESPRFPEAANRLQSLKKAKSEIQRGLKAIDQALTMVDHLIIGKGEIL
jgi:hypothetical protein